MIASEAYYRPPVYNSSDIDQQRNVKYLIFKNNCASNVIDIVRAYRFDFSFNPILID